MNARALIHGWILLLSLSLPSCAAVGIGANFTWLLPAGFVAGVLTVGTLILITGNNIQQNQKTDTNEEEREFGSLTYNLDHLFDYISGLLEDTPEQQEVLLRDLINTTTPPI